MSIKKNFFAPLSKGLGATRRAAMLLLVMMLTTVTTWAATVTLKSSTSTQTWKNNTYVTNSNVTIEGRITVTGNVTLILNDGYTLTASKGIEVKVGNSLTIEGGTNGTGKLTIEGCDDGKAGIGGGSGQYSWNPIKYGNITIKGGRVNVKGGAYGAGIGGNNNSSIDGCGTITINGGIVNATGGTGAAGIGGGCGSKKNGKYGGCGAIVIKGGQVTATGGGDGPGIGPGHDNDDNTSGSLVLGWTNTTDFIKVTGVKSTLNVVYGFSDRLKSINFAEEDKKFNISGGGEATIKDITNLESVELIPKGSEQHQLSVATISGISDSYDLTGSYLDIPFSVSDAEGNTLTLGTDYTATLGTTSQESTTIHITEGGKYTLTITGKGSYAGSKSVDFEVISIGFKKDANGGDYINMPKTGIYYDAKIPKGVSSFKVYDDGGAKAQYSNSYDGGLVLTAPDHYVLQLTGTVTAEVQVNNPLDYLMVYDGGSTSAQKIGDKYGSESGENIGTLISRGKQMTLTFHSDVSGQRDGLDLKVTLKRDIRSCDIANIEDQTYTGSAFEPAVTVTDGETTLTLGTDYEVAYSNNISAGTATITITGKENYAGTTSKTFNIVKATPTVTAPIAVADLEYKGSAQALVNAGSTDFGTLLYSTDGNNYSEDIPTATNAGTYTVYYKVAGDANHNDVSGSIEVTITPKPVTNDGITVTIPSQVWTGSELTPVITVKDGETELIKNTDYTVTAPSGTIQDAGDYTYTITGTGNYSDSKEAMFTILPLTVVVNVTGNGTVTYNDKSAASGETIGVTADKGTDVTLTLAPESGYAVSIEYGYTDSEETTMIGAKLPINGTTATLTVPNDLKDGTYVNLTVTFVSALVGGADEASAVALTDNTVTNFGGGWYKVENDISFDHTLNLLADTYLTIAEGKTMTVNTATSEGILSDYTLFVSGAGALNVTTTEAYNIAVRVGNYVQTGATVTANGYIGIRCMDVFDEFNVTNDFTFSGGQLTATGSGGDGIDADNDITLSCTNATDFIQACSYRSAYGAVKVADGQTLTDGTEASNGMNGYSGTLTGEQRIAIGGKTLHRAVTTSYVDASGTLHENVIAIPLDNTMTTLAAGWYVAQGTVNYTGCVTLNGDVNIILADGKTMNVGTANDRIASGNCINAGTEYSLTIYGQTLQTGILNAFNSDKEAVYLKNYTQHGGNVTIDATKKDAIRLYGNDLTLTRGTLTATGDTEAAISFYNTKTSFATVSGGNLTASGGYGIYGNLNMIGGNVSAISSTNGFAIYKSATISSGTLTATGDINGNVTFTGGTATINGNIWSNATLGWTNATDRIYASSYSGNVTIVEGKSMSDGTTTYNSGDLNDDQKAAIAGKTLQPAVKITLPTDVTASGTNVFNQTDGTYALPNATATIAAATGYTISDVSATGANLTDNGDGTYTLTVGTTDVTVTATVTAKTYTVTLDRQGATTGSESATATYDADMPAITLPTRTGYDFVGYFTETDGGGTQYYNADGTSTRPWDIDAATTLYAKWEILRFEIDDVTYEWTDETNVKVTGYNGTSASITILPSVEHNGVPYNVTEIGEEAFKDNNSLVSIDLLPEAGHITVIGARAFKGCTYLSSILLPASLTTIEDEAFSGCNLASVIIPASLTTIEDEAFSGCNLASVIIPASVTSIGESAFDGCTSLTSVALNGAATIGDDAFPTNANTTVTIASGLYLYNGTEVLSGDVTDMSKLNGKTLTPAIVLADNADNTSAIATAATLCTGGKTLAVQLSGRTLYKDGYWNTLTLPFDVTDGDTNDGLTFSGTPLEGATAMELNSSTSSLDVNGVLTLNFTTATSIVAGKPYIIKWDKPSPYTAYNGNNAGSCSDIVNPVFTGVTVSNAKNDVAFTGGKFMGNYAPLEITVTGDNPNCNDYVVLAGNNRLGYVTTDRTIENGKALGAFRAYFYIPGSTQAREFVLNTDDESTQTGIGHTEITEITENSGAWYTLDGRKLQGKPTQKGLYIYKGKKVKR